MKTFLLFSTLLLLSCSGCSGRQTQKLPADKSQTDTLTRLYLPHIPVMMQTPELRASYLVAHYWDHVNWTDTNYVHHPEITEQGWANFIDLLKLVPSNEANAALQGVLTASETEPKCHRYLQQLAEKYLYDPNSPLRNEEYYIAVLDALIASSALTDAEKIRPRQQRELAQRNRLNTPAINFRYTLASGASDYLYNIPTDYTLIFFNNPGCHACGEVMDALKASQTINQAINCKTLTVLSVYPDEDVKGWKAFLPDYPTNWINAYDKKQVIQEKNLYDLKAIPTLYLLDRQKKVLLKDTTPAHIEQMLSR